MDFHQLLAKMQQLDQPVPETQVAEEPTIADECGDMGPMGAMPTGMDKPDAPPPSMSINLNAQGLDNIEELMKLIKAVNPDAEKGAMPSMPMAMPPLKMLPDLSDEPHMEPDGDEGPNPMKPDLDMDGDSDKEKKDKEEAFGNSVDDSEPEVKDISAAIPDGNDLNKSKTMHKHSYRQGDNPMAMEGEELRASIRAELLRRLEEAKGAK